MVKATSYIWNHGTEVNTRTAVSQKVRLFSYLPGSEKRDWTQIGVMTSFSVNEGRNIEEVRGVGAGDRIMELIPGVTSASINASRVALWLANIMQSFGYKSGIDGVVRSLRHHHWPFDIRQEMIFSEINKEPKILNPSFTSNRGVLPASMGAAVGNNVDGEFDSERNALVTIYEGCWMDSYSFAFSSDSAVIQENCSIKCTDIVAAFDLTFDEDDYLSSNNKIAWRVSDQ